MARGATVTSDQWRKAQEQGMQRFVLSGAIKRAIPMSLIALALLELLDGGGLGRERLLSAAFLERVAFVLTVFLIGGVISSFARWKSLEALYGGDRST